MRPSPCLFGLAVFGLAGLLAQAQTPPTLPSPPQSKAATAPAPTPEELAANDPYATLPVYRRAKAALADVPDWVEPEDLFEIAVDEAIHYPDEATKDFVKAFNDALALSTADSDPYAHAHLVSKMNVELQVITMLDAVRIENFETAHSLAKKADIRRGRLYTELIGAANRSAMQGQGGGQPMDQGLLARMYGGIGYTPHPVKPITDTVPAYKPVDLAQECYALDGSYPYLGVLIALTSYQMEPADRRALLLSAYQAASGETDLLAMSEALGALQRGHMADPSLDPQLVENGIGLLNNMRNAVQSPPATTGNAANDQRNAGLVRGVAAAGNRLITLLGQIDPERMDALKSDYAVLAVPPPPPQMTTLAQLNAPATQANSDPVAALAAINGLPSTTDPEKAKKFQQAVQLAVTISAQHPSEALEAANDALTLMTDDLLGKNLWQVAKLAQRLSNDMSAQGLAEQLIQRCLDVAEQQADALEDQYRNAADTDKPHLSNEFNGSGAAEIDIYAPAAMVDYNLALQRAQDTKAVDFKPMLLLRVAAGRELQHPWWK